MRQLRIVMKYLRQFILLLIAIYIIVALVGLPLYIMVEPNNSSIELALIVYELGLWLSIPILLIALLLRAWRVSLAAVFSLVVFGIVYFQYLIPRAAETEPDMPLVSVMTFNLKGTSADLVEILTEASADIVALQEFSQDSADQVQTLDSMYPYQALYPQADPHTGQGLLSRYPIESDEYWLYPELPHTLGHMRAEIAINGTSVVIYNTHPWPPLGWESGYNDESHRVVVRDIAERAFAEQAPVILAGDFNMTDVFGEYDLLASQFTDSYLAAGSSLGYTFPNYKFRPLPAVLRLDYIWHSQHFRSVDARVWPEYGQSDHSPVLAYLTWIE